MIKNICLSNFKCFENQSFDLGALNVFSGYNGRGKSSVLQSILLFSQSIGANTEKKALKKLHTCGDLTYLGNFEELKKRKDNDDISFSFLIDRDVEKRKETSLNFSYSKSYDEKIGMLSGGDVDGQDFYHQQNILENFDTENLSKKEPEPLKIMSEKNLAIPLPSAFINLLRNVHYISASRLGPVKYVEKLEVPDFHNVGVNGEMSINTLATYKDVIPTEMSLPKGRNFNDIKLNDAVSEWINFILSGGKVCVNQSDQVYSLYITDQNAACCPSYNVGYGYSYILSIVVTSLIAKKDSIVIIENPEAHLHPVAQSRLTLLLTKLAKRGVQVFIETHSEHVINAIRLAILKDGCDISNEDVFLYFFDEDYSIKPLKIKQNGRIDNWPKGFFDQAENDLIEIMRLGAKKI